VPQSDRETVDPFGDRNAIREGVFPTVAILIVGEIPTAIDAMRP